LKANIAIQDNISRLASQQEELLKILQEQGVQVKRDEGKWGEDNWGTRELRGNEVEGPRPDSSLQFDSPILHSQTSPPMDAPFMPSLFGQPPMFPHIQSPHGRFTMTYIDGDHTTTDSSHHITTTNSGNTTVTTTTNSNNNSPIRYF
jgi:hypothetical protein